MKSAFLHELLADGGEVEAMFTATTGPSVPTTVPSAHLMQSFPPITQTGTRRYEGETFKLDLEYSALTYTMENFIFTFGGVAVQLHIYSECVRNFRSLG